MPHDDAPVLLFRPLRPGVVPPAYETEHAAGLDLRAAIDVPIRMTPGEVVLVPCGFAMAIPPGWEAQVRPRSGLATRHAITMPNAPGTIDADYRGEVQVPLMQLVGPGRDGFTIEPGMRIAQMVIAPVARVAIEVTDALAPTSRGGGGFGSTGTR